LVGGFAVPHISAVLQATGQLTRTCPATYARLIETSLMVVCCIGPDEESLKPIWDPTGSANANHQWPSHRGEGWLACMRTRFLHAQVRAMLAKRSGAQKWDYTTWGTPINQEDQLVTLHSFSYNVLRCLQQCGVQFTNNELEAFMHCWRVIGWLCGVPEHLLEAHMSSYQAAELASHSMLVHLVYPAAERSGGVLAQHNLRALVEHLPQRWSYRYHAALARYMLSDEWADGLGLPKSTKFEMWRARTLLAIISKLIEFGKKFNWIDQLLCKIKSVTVQSHWNCFS
jgi:hypothetical protein